jgi:hypothetical protein
VAHSQKSERTIKNGTLRFVVVLAKRRCSGRPIKYRKLPPETETHGGPKASKNVRGFASAAAKTGLFGRPVKYEKPLL